MNSINKKKSSIEVKIAFLVLCSFCLVLGFSWISGMQLRSMLAERPQKQDPSLQPLIEVEKMKQNVFAQVANSRSHFLLNSQKFHDDLIFNKNQLLSLLVNFELKYSLPGVSQIVSDIKNLHLKFDDIFEQAQDYKNKKTETRIIGQFYTAKSSPLLDKINDHLDKLSYLHIAENAKLKSQQQASFKAPIVLIPQILILVSAVSLSLVLILLGLIIRLVRLRSAQESDKEKLFKSAQTAQLKYDEVLSALSQDLIEPLSVISKSTLDSREANSCSLELSEVVLASVHNIENRIQDIVDQTKADFQGITLRIEQIQIDQILEEAQLLLQPLAKKKDIRLDVNTVNPPVFAFMDRERVMRILSNLVGNAIKFSPSLSRIVIKVKSDPQFIYISIKDSGPGIPEEKLGHLFENFWQARLSQDQGSGIGLAVVKTIVEAHGGTVQVESHMGFGSTFTFSLPRRRPAKAHIGRPAPAPIRFAKPKGIIEKPLVDSNHQITQDFI